MVSTTPGKYKLFTRVNDTGDKFFAGVVDTAEELILRISPRIFEKMKKGFNGILGGRGDTDS
jgi:hypothetical protein